MGEPALQPITKVRFLLLGVNPALKALLSLTLRDHEVLEDTSYNMEALMEKTFDPPPQIILCGPAPESVNLVEVAQGLRMQFQETPVFYITDVRPGFNRKLLQKNGFSDAFMFPADVPLFESILKDEILRAAKMKSYRAVRLIDVSPDTKLDFDVYVHLKANNKYIKFSAKGDPLDETRSKRLQKHEITNVQVEKSQMQDFYKFTASQLKKLGNDSAISETERKERKERAVRDLISGLFSDSSKDDTLSQGKNLNTDCQEIVKAYIVDGNTKGSWYEKVLAATQSGAGTYSHASNVATYAALFSMGTGIGKTEDVALIGLLHDIGLVDVPLEVQSKPESKRTPEEQEIYKKHIAHTLKLIKERKMVLTDLQIKIIEQHHEKWNGTGYPKGLVANRIAPEAQIIALADYFDYMINGNAETPGIPVNEAIQRLKKECLENPAVAPYDPEIVKKLITLFPTS